MSLRSWSRFSAESLRRVGPHVEGARGRGENEVCALGECRRIRRGNPQQVRIYTLQPSLQLPQYGGQARVVVRIRCDDDVHVLRGAYVPVRLHGDTADGEVVDVVPFEGSGRSGGDLSAGPRVSAQLPVAAV